jgi:hypothetical protein
VRHPHAREPSKLARRAGEAAARRVRRGAARRAAEAGRQDALAETKRIGAARCGEGATSFSVTKRHSTWPDLRSLRPNDASMILCSRSPRYGGSPRGSAPMIVYLTSSTTT